MSYDTIRYEVTDNVLTLTLNRPERLNAFTTLMAAELEEAFHRASDDDQVRAVVVTGAGSAFCAGMDLSVAGNVFGLDESLSPTLAELDERFDDPDIRDGIRDSGGRVTLAIFDCHKPVIAAINGAAVGIGATMTLAMDVRLASEDARIGFVFGRIGITPEACSTWFLPRIVGMSRALEWCMAAEVLSAEEAAQGGLVRSVHAPDALLDAAYELARLFIRKRSAVSVALTRAMLYRNSAQPHPRAAHLAESLAVLETSRGDGKEGVQAFLEKRDPQFRSKVSTDMPAFAGAAWGRP
jgi:enoyl-CoA hydratase/carnithine racemase